MSGIIVIGAVWVVVLAAALLGRRNARRHVASLPQLRSSVHEAPRRAAGPAPAAKTRPGLQRAGRRRAITLGLSGPGVLLVFAGVLRDSLLITAAGAAMVKLTVIYWLLIAVVADRAGTVAASDVPTYVPAGRIGRDGFELEDGSQLQYW